MATAELQHDASLSGRLRARSRSFIDKFHRSPSRGSRGSENEHAFVANALGQAGVQAGVVGSSFIGPQKQKEDVLVGANVFLQELERVASRPAAQSARLGLKRAGTIELERDEATEHEVNPITSVDENPFEDVKDDAASDKSYDFAETIKILDNDKEVVMRALLDTGMRMNAIARDKAVKSEFLIEPYKGPALKDADGPDFCPTGVVNLLFYFKGYRSAKTWNLEFVVFEDPPFDIALGSAFIKHAGLLKRNDVALPVQYKHQSERERQEQERKTNERNSGQAAAISEEKRMMEQRRRIEKERRERDKAKKR